MKKQAQTNNQIVGNVGLFFVCYQLSRLGLECHAYREKRTCRLSRHMQTPSCKGRLVSSWINGLGKRDSPAR